MRTVYDAANVIDAHLVRQALEAEGIPAFVRGEALTGGIGELGVFGLVAVMVPEAAWPQARDIVAALALGEAEPLAEDDDLTGTQPA
ncbi:putative signal transducing protein [Thermomonas brevis]